MKAYLLPSSVRIAPFGDPVGEAMAGNRTLAARQEEVLSRAGLEVCRIQRPEEIRGGDFLLSYDDVFFTRRVLDDLLVQFRRQGRSIRCGLPAESLLVRRTRALQDLEEGQAGGEKLALYRLYFIRAPAPPGDATALQSLLAQAAPVRARFKEKILQIPNPRNIMGSAFYEHPLTSSVVMHLRHWVHVLWANQLSIQIRWVETILDHKLWTARRLLSATAGTLFGFRWSRNGWKYWALRRFNRIGKNCDIHPTARLELSILGDNVRVGAFSLIRGSMIGNDVTIEDRANMLSSVLGDGCHMSRNASMALCAGYPGGDLSIRGVQSTLFGRDCAMTSGGLVLDVKAQGEIKVVTAAGLKPVGTNFLGACFGHRSYLGADVMVQAGREIPNGAMLVRPPGEILRNIPPDLPPGVPAWVEDGTAVVGKKN